MAKTPIPPKIAAFMKNPSVRPAAPAPTPSTNMKGALDAMRASGTAKQWNFGGKVRSKPALAPKPGAGAGAGAGTGGMMKSVAVKPSVGGVALGASSKVPAGGGMMKTTTVAKPATAKKPAVTATVKTSSPAPAASAAPRRSSGSGNVLHNAAKSLMGQVWKSK
jgi:hypothetical protein